MEILIPLVIALVAIAIPLGVSFAAARHVPKIPPSGWAAMALQLPLPGFVLATHFRHG